MAPDDVTTLLGGFDSAVLTVFDSSGSPVSMRCHPTPIDGTTAVAVYLPEWVDTVEGRAGLMAHSHDEGLWHQRSFTCRGRLERSGASWRFVPEQTILGMGYGRFSLVRMMFRGRRRAARYLAHRGLPRPRVPWDQMKSIKREAFGRQG